MKKGDRNEEMKKGDREDRYKRRNENQHRILHWEIRI